MLSFSFWGTFVILDTWFFSLFLSHSFLPHPTMYLPFPHFIDTFWYLLSSPASLPNFPGLCFLNTLISHSALLSFSTSPFSVSVAPFSHLGGTAEPACSASGVGRATWAPRTTSPTTSTAPSRRVTAVGAPCSCRGAAAVLSVRPASVRRGSCCPPMARCTAPWTAMVWCHWSLELQ